MRQKIQHIKSAPNAEVNNDVFQPFDSVEDAWFWFVTAQQARSDGARYQSGVGLVRRPCEPVDILKVLDHLYRKRRLLRDHLLVLRHYGRRHMAPDPRRKKEERAFQLWSEAFERMRPILERKGIVHENNWVPHYAYEGYATPSSYNNQTTMAAE